MKKNAVVSLYDSCGCLLGTLVLLICVAVVIGIVFGIFCLEGWVFMLLWNWLAVALFGAVPLGYWVCVGIVFALTFLGRVIFGYGRSHRTE